MFIKKLAEMSNKMEIETGAKKLLKHNKLSFYIVIYIMLILYNCVSLFLRGTLMSVFEPHFEFYLQLHDKLFCQVSDKSIDHLLLRRVPLLLRDKQYLNDLKEN
jgi:hypothetical protein